MDLRGARAAKHKERRLSQNAFAGSTTYIRVADGFATLRVNSAVEFALSVS
jgi:hypothetical protein